MPYYGGAQYSKQNLRTSVLQSEKICEETSIREHPRELVTRESANPIIQSKKGNLIYALFLN